MIINIDFCSVTLFYVSRFHRWFFVYSDIVAAQMSTKTISFQRSISGWIFREDKIVSRIKTFCLPFLWLVGQEKNANKSQPIQLIFYFRSSSLTFSIQIILWIHWCQWDFMYWKWGNWLEENQNGYIVVYNLSILFWENSDLRLMQNIFSRKTLVFINVMSTQLQEWRWFLGKGRIITFNNSCI